MFDIAAEFELVVRTEAGARAPVVVRWPSDQEWSDRVKARKVIFKNLGRGQLENEIGPSPGTDLKIYEAIKLNGAPPLTGEEACRILDVLAYCEVRDVEIPGDTATVKIGVCKGEVTHRLKLPTAAQVLRFRKQASKTRQLPYNVSEVRHFLEPGAALWDECAGQSSDYQGPIPTLHKDAAIRGVIEALDRELAAGMEGDDF